MSDDLISRQTAIDYLLDALYDLDEADYVDKEFIEEELKRVPSVQTVQKTGQWIFEKGDGETCVDGYTCSACGRSFHTKVPYFSEYNFCPNCGAKMEV